MQLVDGAMGEKRAVANSVGMSILIFKLCPSHTHTLSLSLSLTHTFCNSETACICFALRYAVKLVVECQWPAELDFIDL